MIYDVEIVCHCWRYSRCLAYQLSSLVRFGRDLDISFRLFTSSEGDPWTARVGYYYDSLSPRLRVRCHVGPLADVLSRAIYRNLAAKETEARLVWFADADYLFGQDCLQTLAEMSLPEGERLFYPRETLINKTHAIGDDYARAVDLDNLELYGWNPDHFRPHRTRRAIGGMQIVTSETARQFGYCETRPRQLRPVVVDQVTDATTMRNRADPHYRRSLGTKGCPIDLPNVFRIRQTQKGRVDLLTRSTSAVPLPVSSPGGSS